MPETPYLALAIASAVAITVALRVAPFLIKRAMKDSALLADLGRWMPLGAITILAVYCLFTIDLTEARQGIPELAAVAATVGMHAWRRNAVLSITAGTGVCILLSHAL